MMPKGVEHRAPLSSSRPATPVRIPMMPKGVEHGSKAAVLNAFRHRSISPRYLLWPIQCVDSGVLRTPDRILGLFLDWTFLVLVSGWLSR